MHSLRPAYLKNLNVSLSTAWLLSTVTEAKGRQDLSIRQKPEVLRALREQALIQSAESSNRIEGVTVDAERLRPILIDGARPRDRSEEELLGYRRALDWIDRHFARAEINSQTILHLHELAQGPSSADAGKWKTKDNEIIELLANGERVVRFRPLSAAQTPAAVEELCHLYRAICESESFPSLLAVGSFIFDFLCIHPFRDGNGRVSRLLTHLLLLQHGYVVGRFVSLEKIIEDDKEAYYDVLKRSSEHWQSGKHNLLPWWTFFLSILKDSYRKFSIQIETTVEAAPKGDLIRGVIRKQQGLFSMAQLKVECPSVSPQLIKKVLAELQKKKQIVAVGKGRGARWRLKK